MRERLLADGHDEVDGRAAATSRSINTCCVTHEAVSKSRQAASRAARTHGRVYVTGCAANLARRVRGPAGERRRRRAPREETAATVAGDVGAIGCVQADVAARPRPRVREDPGRLLVLVQPSA